MVRPDPAETWDLVAKFSGGNAISPACNLLGSRKAELALADKTRAWEGYRRRD
jgi:hypothetical protein